MPLLSFISLVRLSLSLCRKVGVCIYVLGLVSVVLVCRVFARGCAFSMVFVRLWHCVLCASCGLICSWVFAVVLDQVLIRKLRSHVMACFPLYNRRISGMLPIRLVCVVGP